MCISRSEPDRMECLSFPNYGNFVVVGSQRGQIQIVPHRKGRRGWIWQVSGGSYKLINFFIVQFMRRCRFFTQYWIFLRQKVLTVLERAWRHVVVFSGSSFKKDNFVKTRFKTWNLTSLPFQLLLLESVRWITKDRYAIN